jgi:methyl coenzyme M reductase subunit C-like uncharacterized protein (methanogenesis marker protein 7)
LHRDLIAKLIHVMLALDFYKECFEPDFIIQTREFFVKDAAKNFDELNLPSYMLYVDKVLEREAERLRQCLDISTRDKLVPILDSALIAEYITRINECPEELNMEAVQQEGFKSEDLKQTEFD